MPTLVVPGLPPVDYEEDAEKSPRMAFSHGQTRVERTYYVRYDLLDAFIAAMLGFPRIGEEATYLASTNPIHLKRQYYIKRTLPHFCEWPQDVAYRFPADKVEREFLASKSWLFATSVSNVEPMGPTKFIDPATGMPGYQQFRVTVLYEPTTFKLRSDAELMDATLFSEALYERAPYEFHMRRYVTKTVKPTIEYLALPRGKMRWVIGNGPTVPALSNIAGVVDYSSAIPLPSQEINWTWHQVPFIPQSLRSHLGCVNLYTFKDHNKQYPPGTLLVLGAEIKPYRMGNGRFVLDISWRVKYFNPFRDGRGHNFFLRFSNKVDELLFLKITDNGTEDIAGDTTGRANKGQPIFPYADFQELFSWKSASYRDRGNKVPLDLNGDRPPVVDDDVDEDDALPAAAPADLPTDIL